jgi:hypothetical protein
MKDQEKMNKFGRYREGFYYFTRKEVKKEADGPKDKSKED